MKQYGNIALTVSSPQIAPDEPLTLAQAKLLAKVEHDEEDDLLEIFITSARTAAEKETGKELAVKQYDLTLDGFPGCDIELPFPLQAVDLVQYRTSDGTAVALVENTDFIVDLARGLIRPAYGVSWPCFTPYPSGAVLVRFHSGYPASHPFWLNEGKAIMNGMSFLITDWFKNRKTSEAKGAGELPYRAKFLFGMIAKQRAH